MPDSPVPALARAGDPGAAQRRSGTGRSESRHGGEDELLARVLITSWSLATGRMLPGGVAPQALTEEELISFWADDAIGTAARPELAADAS